MDKVEAALLAPSQRSDAARTTPGNCPFETSNSSPPKAQKGGSRTSLDVEKHPMSSTVVEYGRLTVQSLPVELLAEIFILCVLTPPLINEPTKPPKSLCFVCRSWRNIAYSLPGLWTSVSVDMDVISSEAHKMLPDLLECWFSRATPLSLGFKLKYNDIRLERANKTLTTLVLPFSHRLHHLDVDSPDFVWQIGTDLESQLSQASLTQNSSVDDSLSTVQFPVLESVIMRNITEVCDGEDLDIPLFPFAPCLQRVRMDQLSFRGNTSTQLALPWSQLTHLILEHPLESHQWRQIFLMCSRLQHGLFQIYQNSSEGNPPTPRGVVLNDLVDLTLTFRESLDLRILSPFDLPALVTLRVKNVGYDEDNENFWIGVFDQQLATLRRLSLRGNLPFALLLEAAPHIVELEISLAMYSTPNGAFLSFLQPGQGGHLLVPNLKVLIVGLPAECSEGEITTIVDVIKSRSAKSSLEEGNGIERLVVFLDSRNRAEVTHMNMLKKELQPSVDDGLLLEFKDEQSGGWYGRLGPAATEWHEGMSDMLLY